MKSINLKEAHLKGNPVKLTKTGLAVVHPEVELPFYCTNDGVFRRYMSEEEWDSLKGLPFVVFVASAPTVELPEKWKFLWSWTESDYTDYKEGTHNNGGDYAFYKEHNIFGRLNAGKVELLDVTKHTTSAEFGYDEEVGSFQNDLSFITFFDVEGDFNLYAQTRSREDEEMSLSQVGVSISVDDALRGCDYSFDAATPEDFEPPFLEGIEQLKRIQILKDTFGAIRGRENQRRR